jgi:hypothetical protein
MILVESIAPVEQHTYVTASQRQLLLNVRFLGRYLSKSRNRISPSPQNSKASSVALLTLQQLLYDTFHKMTSLINFRKLFDVVTGVLTGDDRFTGLPRVIAVDYETSHDRRARTLKHLLRANHHQYAVLYNRLHFHNHLPHILGSVFLLGGDEYKLQTIYDEDHKELEPWQDAPQEVTVEDWRDFLGNKGYQRAYLDFFEDELVRLDYDWKEVVREYLLAGPEPLINGLISGLGHSMIHLGYAFELNSKDLAMEALVLIATNYDFLHQYIDTPAPAVQASIIYTPVEILEQIKADKRFDNLFSLPGERNLKRLFALQEEAVLEYFHKLQITDITHLHKQFTKLATTLLMTTHAPGDPQYDFFFCHTLTTAYAIRILLPELPRSCSESLIRQHWLFIVFVYIVQFRPVISPQLVEEVDTQGKSWDDIVNQALSRKLPDTHFVKAIRTMKMNAELWPEEDEWYKKAACKMVKEFRRWVGFGALGEEEEVRRNGQEEED